MAGAPQCRRCQRPRAARRAIEKSRLTGSERAALLAAGPAGETPEAGITVCACLRVTRGAIEAAIAQGCHDVRAIGAQVRAGTQCGSCIPELERLVRIAAEAR